MGGDSRLSSRVAALLGSPLNVVYLSSASVWEICLKYQLGKLHLPDPPGRFLEKAMREYRLSPLPVAWDDCLQTLTLPLHHSDPFDRLLVAQCLQLGCPLVSKDSLLLQYNIELIW